MIILKEPEDDGLIWKGPMMEIIMETMERAMAKMEGMKVVVNALVGALPR